MHIDTIQPQGVRPASERRPRNRDGDQGSVVGDISNSAFFRGLV